MDDLKSFFSFSPNIEGYNLRKGVLAGLVFFLVTGVVTGLISTPLYQRMVPIRAFDYLFLFTTSFLAAVYFGKERCEVVDNRIAALGGATGFFAFACPICNAVLLAFFSSSAIMAYIDPLRPFLGVVSTIALGGLILRERKNQ
jgi:hypothetical protein